jgi:3-deoxy-7-phosphoheptulonate synthase
MAGYYYKTSIQAVESLIILNMIQIQDVHVREMIRLIAPSALKAELPISSEVSDLVQASRARVTQILQYQDPRMLVVIGPCSIHDVDSALEYAERLNALREKVADQMEIVMRVYFEKPRTTVGWKGLINDPHLDDTQDIEYGLRLARQLLLDIADMGIPAATEFLDPIVPQYISDLVTWAAIGARTTESQTHREMASGLSMPVGFKNGTDGGLQVAVDAMLSAKSPHSFLGIDQDGCTSIVRTTGNTVGHVVLRGGRALTNYDSDSIDQAEAVLQKASLPTGLMVDCSHANSGKIPARQEDVWRSIIQQRVEGKQCLIGVMIESFLKEGSQPFPNLNGELAHGVSITDACISWETTERMLLEGHELLRKG